MKFTGTWRTRNNAVVVVDENGLAEVKDGSFRRAYVVDEEGNADVEAGKGFDLVQRLSGFDKRTA